MKTVIVSGATGLLGRSVLERLENEDVRVIALQEAPELLIATEKRTPLCFDEFFNLNENFDNVAALHLAFPRKSDEESVMGGIGFAYKFIEKACSLGANLVVETSSQSVYDIHRQNAAVESDVICPATLYGVAKAYLEDWIQDYCDMNDVECVHLRLSSLVGPKYTARLTCRMTQSAHSGNGLVVNNTADTFSFLHVEDCADALVTVLLSEGGKSGVYNVGTSEYYSLVDVANVIKSKVEANFNVKVPVEINTSDKPGINRRVNTSKFDKAFDWNANWNLERIIDEEISKLI